ncbi:MAG: hypothetical protein Pars2KO_06370 [Parasphingorhabdus sp.]
MPVFDPSENLANNSQIADQPQPKDGERRKAQRYIMAIPALMEFADDEVISVTITDMSLAGFACDSRQIFTPGTRCWLKLPSLPGAQKFSVMETRVVRCDGSHMGCAFAWMLKPEDLKPFLAEYQVAA